MKLQINPFLYREMKRYAGSRRFYTGLSVFVGFLALVTGVGYNMVLRASWDQVMDYSGVAYVYFILAGILGLTVLLMVPSFAAGSLASEWEDNTMELLLTSSVRPSEIVVGKLMSSICLAVLMVVAGMPFLAVTFIIGGIHKKHLIEFILLMIVESVFVGSVGVSISASSRKADTAGLKSYSMSMGLSVGTPLIAAVMYLVEKTYQRGTDASGQGSFGGVMLIFLLNPLVTVASLLTDQMGYRSKFEELLCVLGPVPSFFLDHWCFVSIAVQLMVSLSLLFLSTWKIKNYYL